jgi:hypothetical protein
MFGHFLGAVSKPPLAVVGTSKKGKVLGAKRRNTIKKNNNGRKMNIERETNNSSEVRPSKGKVRTGKKRYIVNKLEKSKNGYEIKRESQNNNMKGRHILHRTKDKIKTAKKRNLMNQTKDTTKINNVSKRTGTWRSRMNNFIKLHPDKHIQSNKQANTAFKYKQRLKNKG